MRTGAGAIGEAIGRAADVRLLGDIARSIVGDGLGSRSSNLAGQQTVQRIVGEGLGVALEGVCAARQIADRIPSIRLVLNRVRGACPDLQHPADVRIEHLGVRNSI